MIMLFAGSCYYPRGGWEDFRGYFDSLDDAKKFLVDKWEDFDICCCPWAHFVQENKIILEAIYDDLFHESSHQWEFASVKEE